MSPGRQQTRELANGLVRIFNVFQAFEAGDVLKLRVRVRQRCGKISVTHIDVPHHEDFGVQIAGLHLESRLGKARRKRSFAGRNVQQFAARKWIENPRYGFVDFRPRDRYRRATSIRGGICNLLLSRRAQSLALSNEDDITISMLRVTSGTLSKSSVCSVLSSVFS